ncbi:MAG TPA: ribonuclease H [Polyangiaceae bacterium]|nr:ribonuclease H [Polyangiaceae bacterium]
MPWVRALLHGQQVYARAKPDGTLLVQGNRVDVCYTPNTSRLYKARSTNLVREEPPTVLPDETCAPRPDSAARLKNAAVRAISKKPMQSTAIPKAPKDAIIAYADGACSGNPGPAGLGIVVIDATTKTEISEHLGQGTNNIAELTAIERVLDTVEDTARPLVIHTDSAYAIGVLSKGWKAKANIALIERVRERLVKRPGTTLVHVRGHAGIELNERADELAREAVRTQSSRSERVG